MREIKKELPALTNEEKQRLIEIDYYLFIKHLLECYNNSIVALDVLEALAQLYNCSLLTIKKIATSIYTSVGAIVPSREELSILLYKEGMPLSKLRTKLHLHPQTIYRYIDEYIEDGAFEYVPKLTDQDRAQIESFMTQLRRLTDWR